MLWYSANPRACLLYSFIRLFLKMLAIQSTKNKKQPPPESLLLAIIASPFFIDP
jgi:hypothetical protein